MKYTPSTKGKGKKRSQNSALQMLLLVVAAIWASLYAFVYVSVFMPTGQLVHKIMDGATSIRIKDEGGDEPRLILPGKRRD